MVKGRQLFITSPHVQSQPGLDQWESLRLKRYVFRNSNSLKPGSKYLRKTHLIKGDMTLKASCVLLKILQAS